MHRLPKAAWLVAVMASLLAALPAPAVVEARGSTRVPRPDARPWSADAVELARTAPQAIKHGTTDQHCTGWLSTYEPPLTVNVLRTHGPDKGNVETVDFRTYVGWVLSTEWTAHYPLEALKVGAVAVKQYAWYYAIVYRGGKDVAGNCYDVVDNTNDQYYDPDNAQHPRPGPNKVHLQAIAATWNISLRKWSQASGASRFFPTGYRSGQNVGCGEERDGYRLYQHSIYRCATAPNSLSYEQILRLYLNPNLEVVNPGAHDIVGTAQGDFTALTPADETALAPRIYQALTPAGVSPAETSGVAISATDLLGTASYDLNGDGREDLVTLHATSATSLRIDAALSDGVAGYQAMTTWLPATELGVPVAGARLLPGDFNADSLADVGILVPVPPPAPATSGPLAVPQAKLVVVAQRKTGLPAAPVTWWSGALDMAATRAWVADLNGDGATDLLVAQEATLPDTTPTDIAPSGVHFAAALSAPPLAGLAPLATWFDAPDLLLAELLATVGDVNRDGLDDLFVAFPAASGQTRVDVIKGNRKRVKRATFWTASLADPMPLASLKIESADVNEDGQSDIVLFRDAGIDGTTLVVLRATYKKLKPYATVTDATLDWSTATPY
jgi:Stage II sporulation protein